MKIKELVETFTRKSNRALVAKNLRTKIKKGKRPVKILLNPITNEAYTGSIKEIAKKLGVSVYKVSTAFKKQNILNGAVPLVFNSVAGRNSFLKNKYKDDTISEKQLKKEIKQKTKLNKNSSISGGMNLLENLNKGYTFINKGKKHLKFWNANTDYYSMYFSDAIYSVDDVRNLLEDMLLKVREQRNLGPQDRIRAVIEDPNLRNSVSTPLLKNNEMNVDKIISVLEAVIESNEVYSVGNETIIEFTTIKLSGGNSISKELFLNGEYKGAGKQTDGDININMNIFKKKSLIEIKNKDKICCARAIMTGLRRNEYGSTDKQFISMRKGFKAQREEAVKLHTETGIPLEPCGIDEIKIFEEHLGIEIIVIDGDFLNEIIYPNTKEKNYTPYPKDKQIYLYKHNNHYDLIASNKLAGFFGKDYFCYNCKKCYWSKDSHNCKFKCSMCCCSYCPTNIIDKIEYNFECKKCNRFFGHKKCLELHTIKDKKTKLSVCDKVWKCNKCNIVFSSKIYKRETHICGEYLCGNCNCLVPKEHKCYMMPKPLKPHSEKYIFYDFESDISGDIHIVNYSISMYFNDPTPIIHYNIDEFCKWAFDKKHKGYTFIAHNSRGYDCKFIMRWIILNSSLKPFTIYAGQKIMMFSVKQNLNIKFLDSLNFLTMPLSRFPKTFGQKELKKGYFPHWFNVIQNKNYIGVVPPMKYFGYNNMKTDDRNNFIKWWVVKRLEKYVWNNAIELKEYCISDVDILRKCVIIFRNLYIKIANIDPLQYITIAGVCMGIFKFYYVLKEYPILYEEENYEKMNKEDKQIFNKKIKEMVFNEKKLAIFSYDDANWFRGAFFGGRTNACKLIYNFCENEVGMYSDITSLYPTVNYYDFYPTGHYIKITDIQPIHLKNVINKKYYGVVDCFVIPPKNLYHPVLPRKGEKLFFDLTDKRGKWATPELNVAIDKGYIIEEVFEIRHWEEKSNTIFKDYVARFLKIKQEASNYPDWVKNENDKQKYINDYEKNQGIKLDKNNISFNPGLRAIAKLCLNSLWGKFGQRTNMSKTELITNKAEFFDIITNEEYENINWLELTDEKMEITYSIKDKFVENDYNTNIAVAVFTTSNARMRLYEALDLLKHQVLYFDTDSVVYAYNKTNKQHKFLTNGDLLGEWTDELEGYKMVGTFCSGGPKNYSYKKEKENKDGEIITKYVSKVKGFCLNHQVSQLINHETMIQTIINRENDINYIECKFSMIKRNKNGTLSNYIQPKKYSFCYDKRIILNEDINDNIDTIPIGWEGDTKWLEFDELEPEFEIEIK